MISGRRVFRILLVMMFASYHGDAGSGSSNLKSIIPIMMLSMMGNPKKIIPVPVPVPYSSPPVVQRLVPIPVPVIPPWPHYYGHHHHHGVGFGHLFGHGYGNAQALGHVSLSHGHLYKAPLSHHHEVKTLLHKNIQPYHETAVNHLHEYPIKVPLSYHHLNHLDTHSTESYPNYGELSEGRFRVPHEYDFSSKKIIHVPSPRKYLVEVPFNYNFNTKQDIPLSTPLKFRSHSYNKVWQPPEPQISYKVPQPQLTYKETKSIEPKPNYEVYKVLEAPIHQKNYKMNHPAETKLEYRLLRLDPKQQEDSESFKVIGRKER